MYVCTEDIQLICCVNGKHPFVCFFCWMFKTPILIQNTIDFIHTKRRTRRRGNKGSPSKNFCLRLGLHCATYHESGTFCRHQSFFSCLCADVWIRNKNASVDLGLVTFWKILNPECQVILGIRMNVLRFIISLNGACQR